MNNRKVRVRFAPSPTGPLHIGGVRTALYNYLFAKKHDGDFILRIEDTDQTRYVAGAEDYIVESLKWCGINYNEGFKIGGNYGPYVQSERKEIYKKYVQQLLDNKSAYYAFDTPEELDTIRKEYETEKRTFIYNYEIRTKMNNSFSLSEDEVKERVESGKPYVIRFRIPENDEVDFYDIIRENISVNTSTLDDKVIFKSDGLPTYHLSNVDEDNIMEITNIILGEEWLPSCPLHVLLYRSFGWEDTMPKFAHLPLLLNPNGKGKLSKRDGDKLGFPVFPLEWKTAEGDVLKGYRESGYFPEAFINILSFLGWNPGTEQEIFSMEELIAAFSLEKVGKSGSKFDPDKAKWFNQHYIRTKTDDELARLYQPILKAKGLNADIDYISKICGLVKERVCFVEELWEQSFYFFVAPTSYDDKIIKKRWENNTPQIMSDFASALNEKWHPATSSLKQIVEDYSTKKQIGLGQIMNILRLLLVGSSIGPDLFTIAELIGKNEVLKRIEYGINNIKSL